jgi:hypothetical protein
MKAVYRKRGRSLVPVDQEGLDILSRLRDERDVTVEIKQARNPRHHRLFFAILKFIVEHTDQFDGIEQAKTAIKVACGEVDPFIDPGTGKTFWITRSINWSAMDQTRFSAFFDRACWVIANRWMPEGTTPESVRAEIEAMIEPSHMRGAA